LIDTSKVHTIDYKGQYHSVQVPLNIARPPQGHPVLIQEASSENSREFAAQTAEVIFTAQQSIGRAQAFYKDVKSKLSKYGRTPDQLLILPGISLILADTVEEARDIENQLFDAIDIDIAIKQVSELLDIDLSAHPLDKPLSLDGVRETDDGNVNNSRQLILDLLVDEQLTLKQLVSGLAGARGHFSFTGTPLQLADVIETWFLNGAADGFNILPQIYPSGLDLFVDKVIPELQYRGLFRTAYEYTTLRGNLGLARPANNRHHHLSKEVV
jgi:alkanesulfonate monooxygenase SsuD/methylene tetrahydromethanopterin reductase-like flavin-dependent oxidoreductase (luciferase family)